jgi:fructosamine-3-kinase
MLTPDTDIGAKTAEATLSQEQLSAHGPAYLRSVLTDAAELQELDSLKRVRPEQVVVLGGGIDAVTYLLPSPNRDVVVKLNDSGLEAEAEALRAWASYTPRVPEVLAVGAVPSTASDERPVKYLLLTALTDEDGRIVRTGADHLNRSPSSARELGRALGAELHCMHQAANRQGFGNFADSPGAERTYRDWGTYLEDFFDHHADYVRGLGIGAHDIDAVGAFIRRCSFTTVGRYLHGDVTIRNIAIHGDRPLRVGLFDPNPVIGDPSWDIAPLMNNVEFNERGQRHHGVPSEVLLRDRQLLAGVWESYPGEVTEDSLLTAQLIQAVLQAEHREERYGRGDTDASDVKVTHEFIRTVVERMAA